MLCIVNFFSPLLCLMDKTLSSFLVHSIPLSVSAMLTWLSLIALVCGYLEMSRNNLLGIVFLPGCSL